LALGLASLSRISPLGWLAPGIGGPDSGQNPLTLLADHAGISVSRLMTSSCSVWRGTQVVENLTGSGWLAWRLTMAGRGGRGRVVDWLLDLARVKRAGASASLGWIHERHAVFCSAACEQLARALAASICASTPPCQYLVGLWPLA